MQDFAPALLRVCVTNLGLPVDPRAPNFNRIRDPAIAGFTAANELYWRARVGDPTLGPQVAQATGAVLNAAHDRYVAPFESGDIETGVRNIMGDGGTVGGHVAVAIVARGVTRPSAPLVTRPGGVRDAAVRAHAALRHPIRIKHSTVAVVEVELPGGQIGYYASGSGARLRPRQVESLVASGVPRENLLKGAAFRSANRAENHAERVILRHLPEGARVKRWGISWTADQRPIPCPKCRPFVQGSSGVIEGQ